MREKLINIQKKKRKKNKTETPVNDDKVNLTATKAIGGLNASDVNIISQGLAASGVDVFLPASSYAKPLVDDEGKVFREIAFGMQHVDNSDSVKDKDHHDSSNVCQENPLAAADTSSNKVPAIEITPGHKTDLQSYWAAATGEIAMYHSHLKSALDLIETRGNTYTGDQKISPRPVVRGKFEERQSVKDGYKASNLKRSRKEFAQETMTNIVNEVRYIKKRMDSSNKRPDHEEKGSNVGNSSPGITHHNQFISHDKRVRLQCTEDFPTQKVESANGIRKLTEIVEQDIILYNELSRSLIERSLKLATIRKEKEHKQTKEPR